MTLKDRLHHIDQIKYFKKGGKLSERPYATSILKMVKSLTFVKKLHPTFSRIKNYNNIKRY